MASSSRTTSIPLSADDVIGRTQAWCIELKKRFQVTGSRCKVLIFTGRSGTGKSSMLEDLSDLSGYSDQSVDAVTMEFQISRADIENEEYFILDTPGFDPENEKSTFHEIVRGIQAIQPYAQVVGVLFFTCITAQRFDPFDRKLVTFIRALCGDDYIPNITFVTTFWTATGPKQQAVFTKQLEKLRHNWTEDFNGHAPRTYQHGREYDADGVDTGRFLDWFEDRDQIAQHGKDMIARYYGGSDYNNTVPNIVRELAAGTPVHKTVAGRLLRVNPPVNEGPPSEKSAGGSRAGREQKDSTTGTNSKRQSSESTDNTQNTPQTNTQTTSTWLPFAQSVVELATSVIQKNGFGLTYSSGQGIQVANSRSTTHRSFPGDPYSVVDTLKGQGIDSSRANRLRLASEFGIGGTPFSAEWNDSLRRQLQRRS